MQYQDTNEIQKFSLQFAIEHTKIVVENKELKVQVEKLLKENDELKTKYENINASYKKLKSEFDDGVKLLLHF